MQLLPIFSRGSYSPKRYHIVKLSYTNSIQLKFITKVSLQFILLSTVSIPLLPCSSLGTVFHVVQIVGGYAHQNCFSNLSKESRHINTTASYTPIQLIQSTKDYYQLCPYTAVHQLNTTASYTPIQLIMSTKDYQLYSYTVDHVH